MPYCPRLARFLLAALLAAVSSGLAFAVETPGPSRYEGRRFVPWAGDSADFQAVRDLIAQGDTLRLPNVDGRDMHRARVKLYDRADTLNLALRARLAGRTPVDSLAIATTWVNEYDAVNPARGAVSGRTLPAARVALGILERQLGSDHPALIAPLQRMAAVLTTIARANEALALGERQIALLERLTPYDTSAVSAALVSQASRRSTLGDYPGSARDAQRALAMREARFGAGSLQTADPIEWIAIAAARQGRYAEALAGFERCESIRRAGRSTGDTRLARALFNQAEILNQMGETDSARVRLGRALAIWELPQNNASPEGANGHRLMGALHRASGDYENARREMQRAYDILRVAMGPNSTQAASSAEGLAGLLEEMGDFAAARPLRQAALTSRITVQGAGNGETARARSDFARLLLVLGERDSARVQAERALTAREKAYDAASPNLLNELLTLGDIRRADGDHAGALALYARAERAVRDSMRAGDARLATVLRRVGHARLAMDDARGADGAYAAGREVATRALGAGHPLTADLTADLANARGRAGDTAGALALALEAEAAGARQFELQSRTLSEREALLYADVRASGRDVAMSLLARGRPGSADVHRVWDVVAADRAQVLDELAARRRALRRAEAPATDSLRRAYESASGALAALVVRGAGGDSSFTDRLARASRRLEQTQQALGTRSRAFRDEQARSHTRIETVAKGLPAGGALVAYARYSPERREAGTLGSDQLLAFVLPSPGGAATVVALGSASHVDSLARAWRADLSRPTPTEEAWVASGTALRRAIWDPIAARLGAAKRVLVVPDGELNVVPFAALPGADGRALVERGMDVHLLASERDLAPVDAGTASGHGLLALGGAWFDSLGAEPAPAMLLAAAAPVGGTWRGRVASCSEFRGVRFAPLPGTRAEAEAVAEAWLGARSAEPAMRLDGAEATEAALKRFAPGRRVLHLATHGFFVNPECGGASSGGRGIGGLAQAPASGAAGSTAHTGEDSPLRLSGLALTGANRRADAPAGAEDGVLTAEELAALDLGGVEWAVLSACDTGVGEIGRSEGVFGLRRALQVAGVRTVLSSLWSVEDESTRRWMAALYRHRLGGEDTAASVNGAMRDELARRRAAGESTHPFHWAGFVASGDWR